MNYSKNTDEHNPNTKKRKKRRKRKNSFFMILIRIFFILIFVCGFAVAGAMLGTYMGIIESTEAINVEDVVPEFYTSFIYDADGNEIDSLHKAENREYISLDAIPKNLQNAVISIEDERFYEHNGIDIKGIFRALVINIQKHELSQGASTLTQQLIKNEVLDNEKKFKRKIQEQYLAISFEKELTRKLGSKKKAKDYILELYLNSIALNHGLNGVETAAKFYFGKSASELNLAECACIAGITQNPYANSPVSNPEKSRERQLLVLNKMLELGYISQAEYEEAKADDIFSRIVGRTVTEEESNSGSSHSYFVDALIVQIANDLRDQKNMTRTQAYDLIYSRGLRIESTLDQTIQAIMEEDYLNDDFFPKRGNTFEVDYAISVIEDPNNPDKQTHYSRTATVYSQSEAEAFAQSVKDEILSSGATFVMDNLQTAHSLQSAMVVMDYHNGQVKGLVGGRGPKLGDLVLNRATQTYRHPGSCFKPLASYAPAIDMGILSPGTVIDDSPLTIGSWSPKNWDGRFKGPTPVRNGIRDSMNVLAVKAMMMVGYDTSFEYLLNFGFTSLIDSEERNGQIYSDKNPSTALGGLTDGVSVIELTAAYSTIANKGEYNKPILYTRVLDHDGKVLLENASEPRRVIKESTAFMLTDMMEDVITGGGQATGHKANFRNLKMHIAGKTGTSTDTKDLTFAGYTPYYCAGIWLGYDIQKTIPDGGEHLILWRDIMERIHTAKGLTDKAFEIPNTVTKKALCSITGKSPLSGCPTITDYVGTDIQMSDEKCSGHAMIRVDKVSGMLANEFCPKENVVSFVKGSKNVAGLDMSSLILDQVCIYHTAETSGEENEEDNNLYVPEDEPEENTNSSENNNSSPNNTENNNPPQNNLENDNPPPSNIENNNPPSSNTENNNPPQNNTENNNQDNENIAPPVVNEAPENNEDNSNIPPPPDNTNFDEMDDDLFLMP